MTDTPIWEQRFRAPKITLPRWSRHAPDRTVFESTESGVWQVHSWDVASGVVRQVSDHPVGVLEGYATVDGAGIIFWQEDTGDETGLWLLQSFDGGSNEPFVQGVPVGWHEGIAQAPGVVALGISDRDGFGIWVSHGGAPAERVAWSSEWLALAAADMACADIAALSTDGRLLALQHAEGGSLIHPALRVLDAGSGQVRGERRDEGRALHATAWSPVAGDQRLAVAHERQDREGAALWNLADDTWHEIDIDLPGDVTVADWWPDATALLLRHGFRGRTELYRADPDGGSLRRLDIPAGTVADARVRPDGTVWVLQGDATMVARVIDDRGRQVLRAQGASEGPSGRPFEDWTYENDEGAQVHGWLVSPDGEGPWPVMLYVHGGPHWLYEDRYMPEVQTFVDAGFVVAMPNYRGSTGYGRAWRDALTGRPGFADVDDVTAGYRDLVQRGIGDAARSVVAGWSWGGYITLMQLGRNPALWRCGVAAVPVGDYVRAYAEEAPALQAMDRALFGGAPQEVPERYAGASPITYAGRVEAPVLFVIGENDSRCPLGQALAYVDELASLDKPHQVYRFATGHGSLDTDEDVRQHRVILDFLHANVPGLTEI